LQQVDHNPHCHHQSPTSIISLKQNQKRYFFKLLKPSILKQPLKIIPLFLQQFFLNFGIFGLRGGRVAKFKAKVNGIEGGNKIERKGFDFKMDVNGESSR
jgi:hypothetical protein